jgi:hypothetical protein
MLAESHDASQPGEPLVHSYHRSSERAGIRPEFCNRNAALQRSTRLGAIVRVSVQARQRILRL